MLTLSLSSSSVNFEVEETEEEAVDAFESLLSCGAVVLIWILVEFGQGVGVGVT